ncbi:MAG: hypothetical protein ACKO23_07555 [Gemmataceae bacterium]
MVLNLLHIRTAAGLACSGLLALCCSACKDNRPPVFPVEGKVVVAGKPAQRALITLHPVKEFPGETLRPIGQVDEQGNFKLTTFSKEDGAPEGEYKVSVVCYLASRSSPREDPVPVNVLPARYGNPETSQVRVQVKKGSNRLEPIELKVR